MRRQIAALEACGLQIARFILPSWGSELVDQADKLDVEKTRVVLELEIAGLLVNLLMMALTQPLACLKALWLMLQTTKGSERNILYHFA
jgi:colanic acid/amylovoran biosynthesis glycosyltransferase